MTAFAGVIAGGAFQLDPIDSPTARTAAFVEPSIMVPALADRTGALTFGGPIVVAPQAALAGVVSQGYGEVLLEKILVIPRTKPLGFVLSASVFTVEVWSTFQRSAKLMTSIGSSGAGEATISNPFGVPLVFWPTQSRTFTITVPQSGSAEILQVFNFVFSGVSGTDLTITGSRLTVFSVDMDWSVGFEEGIEYFSDVMTALSGQEQRVALRTIPRYTASYRAVGMTQREAASMDALLWGWKARAYGVPWWQDAQPLKASLSIGNTVVTVDTPLRAFEVGGLVMIWKDQFTYESLTIASLTSTTITLQTPVTMAWTTSQTYVVPVKRGRLRSPVKIERPANYLSAVDLLFSCEVV